MAQRCQITYVGVQTGNTVSHSNRKARRRFVPNLQNVSFVSDILGTSLRMRVSVATLRTIDHNGGLDAYLLSTSSLKLSEDAVKLKRQLRRKLAAKK